MKPLVWFAGCVLCALSVVTAIGSLVAASWFSDERFGGIGFLFAVVSLLALGALGFWSEDEPWVRQPRLSRSARKELRREQERIALAKAIADAEREAGIR